jgi:hypothetical protein
MSRDWLFPLAVALVEVPRTRRTIARGYEHAFARAARLWATPMYRLAYDPDGRPRHLRRRDSF